MVDDQRAGSRLFTGIGTEAVPDSPALLGGRCNTCGYVFLPMQHYGCERCGSQDLSPMPIGGRGRLVASARVHIHAAEGRSAPFTVGSIITDDGAVVRALLDVAGDDVLKQGIAMTTRLVPETRPNGERDDLRFAPLLDAQG